MCWTCSWKWIFFSTVIAIIQKILLHHFYISWFCIRYCSFTKLLQVSKLWHFIYLFSNCNSQTFLSLSHVWVTGCLCTPDSHLPSLPTPYPLEHKHTWGSLHPMQRWQSPWIVCITPPPPPPTPVFKSAASTHTLRRWFSTWRAPLQPEYLHSFLCAAECVLLGLCSDGWVDFSVLWIILTVTAAHSLQYSKISRWQSSRGGSNNNTVSQLARKEKGVCTVWWKRVLGEFFQPNCPFALQQFAPNKTKFNFLVNSPLCKTGVTLPLTSSCTVIHSRFVSNESSHLYTFLCVSFYEAVPVISSTASRLPLGSLKNFSLLLFFFSFFFPLTFIWFSPSLISSTP